jgi:hypothetical protein
MIGSVTAYRAAVNLRAGCTELLRVNERLGSRGFRAMESLMRDVAMYAIATTSVAITIASFLLVWLS